MDCPINLGSFQTCSVGINWTLNMQCLMSTMKSSCGDTAMHRCYRIQCMNHHFIQVVIVLNLTKCLCRRALPSVGRHTQMCYCPPTQRCLACCTLFSGGRSRVPSHMFGGAAVALTAHLEHIALWHGLVTGQKSGGNSGLIF